jgi:hypothetical protein
MHHWFFSSDLTFYIKAAAFPKPRACLASCSRKSPCSTWTRRGGCAARKVRTKHKVIREIVTA